MNDELFAAKYRTQRCLLLAWLRTEGEVRQKIKRVWDHAWLELIHWGVPL